MSNYFHAKVRFLRQMDNGLIKQIKEEYLVDAMSFTECEARVLQEVGEGMREVTIDAITKSPINEVLPVGDSDLWFKCKVTYSVTDEETEKDKKVTTYLLINASDAKEAYERCQEHLKDMLVPFEIPDVRETKIIEVYDYQKQAPAGFKKVAGSERAAIDPSAVKLSVEMLNRRDEVKYLFGDKYGERVSKAIEVLKARMKEIGETSPIKAVLSIGKERELEAVEGSLLIAAAVEMSEGAKDGPDYDSDEYRDNMRKAEDELNFDDDPDNEEFCAMHSDSVEMVDPTADHGVTDSELGRLVAGLGYSLTSSEVDNIEAVFEGCEMGEFAEFLDEEYGIDIADATKVYHFLKE